MVFAVTVDLSRMVIYGVDISLCSDAVNWPMVIAASVAAFASAYLSTRILGKVTIRTVQIVVSALLIVIAVGIIAGLL